MTIALLLLVASCGGGDAAPVGSSVAPAAPPTTTSAAPITEASTAATTTATPATSPAGDPCAHVIDGEVSWQGETATVSATVRSADTGWDKYADAWEVRTVDGDVLGIRELLHPHENEQPFTRSLSGVSIPEGTTEVMLAARDSVDGWCGATLVVPVPEP